MLKLSVENLESRNLMATTGYGPEPQAPTIAVYAETSPVVGGHENIAVGTPTPILGSVTYKISGPGLAVKSQVWNTSTASYVRTSGEAHNFGTSPKDSDSFNFYWGETPGTYTVKITSVYNDKSHTTFDTTKTFEVAKPTFQTFTVTSSPTTFSSSAKPGWIGFVQSGKANGAIPIQFNATVTSPVAATAGFVQQATSIWAKIVTANHVIFSNSPDNANILDVGYNQTPYMNDYSVGVPANVKTQVGNNKTGDAPAFLAKIVDNDLFKSIEYHLSLSTYLDYKPVGGIHVELAKASWSVGGTATYSGPIGSDIIPSNWKVSYDKPGSWQVQGINFPVILTWTSNWLQIEKQNTAIVDLTLSNYNRKNRINAFATNISTGDYVSR